SVGEVRYEPAGEHTNVTWDMVGDMGGNILGRYLGLVMDKAAGPMFEKGLQKLKTAVEAGSPAEQDPGA
ncbi:MAG: SRPBCC family protein, partial [Acidobacteriota bacterium]